MGFTINKEKFMWFDLSISSYFALYPQLFFLSVFDNDFLREHSIDVTHYVFGCIQFSMEKCEHALYVNLELCKWEKSSRTKARTKRTADSADDGGPGFTANPQKERPNELLEDKLSYGPVCPSVGRSVGWSISRSVVWFVCHNFRKGREVSR